MSKLIEILDKDEWTVQYDKENNRYRVSYFEEFHFCDEIWFDAYEDKEIRSDFPNCFIGDIVWYTFYRKEPDKCKISMLQQKADKSWKIRLKPEHGGVFDITLELFNEYCFYTYEEAEDKIRKTQTFTDKS